MQGEVPTIPDDIVYGAMWVGVFIVLAKTMADDKRITNEQYENVYSEIFGALEGKSDEQRHKDRMQAIADKLFPITDDMRATINRLYPPGSEQPAWLAEHRSREGS